LQFESLYALWLAAMIIETDVNSKMRVVMNINLKQMFKYLLAGEESRPGFTDYWNVVFLPGVSPTARFWLGKLKVLLCLGAAIGVSDLLTRV
jgi:hypothetical protein